MNGQPPGLADLPGVGKSRLHALGEAGILTVHDLLMDVPISYRDMSNISAISSLTEGETACVQGTLVSLRVRRIGQLSIVQGFLRDDTGGLGLVWFNQPWIGVQLRQGDLLHLYGRVTRYKDALSLQHPIRVTRPGIVPVYRTIAGFPNKIRERCVQTALLHVQAICPETLPASILKIHALLGLQQALRQIHGPENHLSLLAAQRRFSFENLILYQTAVRQLRAGAEQGIRVPMPDGFLDSFWRLFPFEPTGAQQSALKIIASDMGSGRQMRRLLQGDVGSGKTAVALGAAMLAASFGLQTALMVPTEILARQHLDSAMRILGPAGVTAGLLLGGMSAAERRNTLAAIEDGTTNLVIGTHALISKGVTYQNLGLVITDEQHRFGVRQRGKLGEDRQGIPPHVLVMSATPIPRTLAMVVYGDLDITILNEMPKGRQPVRTRIVLEAKRDAMYDFVRQRVASGEQAYVVCPLLEESEEADALSAKGVYAELDAGPMRGVQLGLAYGSQTSQEKAASLQDFRAGRTQVLIATTVVEVGVDNPNATIMVIEGADRFGLSQLHQLRGRVGRGDKTSWCFLLGRPNDRLQALCQSQDGLVIAEKDLQLRGPGDFLGTRQHGHFAPDAMGMGDMRLIEETRACIEELSTRPALADDWQQVKRSAVIKYRRAVEEIAMY